MPCFRSVTGGDELEDFLTGLLENFLDVDALDDPEAVFDEEGVGLPSWRIGAAIYRCEVLDGVQVGW